MQSAERSQVGHLARADGAAAEHIAVAGGSHRGQGDAVLGAHSLEPLQPSRTARAARSHDGRLAFTRRYLLSGPMRGARAAARATPRIARAFGRLPPFMLSFSVVTVLLLSLA